MTGPGGDKTAASPYALLAELLGATEPPLLFTYTDDLPEGTVLPPEEGHVCLFALLAATRKKGTPVAVSRDRYGCRGAGRYLGFLDAVRRDIEHFLSCGIPGRLEGERYKKSPEIARAWVERASVPRPSGTYGLFTRADAPPPAREPLAVIFFATPDVLAGLHFLANYDREDDAVVAPFASGCGAIVGVPLAEASTPSPRAVIGLFDPSARPYAEGNLLSFTVPHSMFLRMAGNAPESFLTKKSWEAVKRRAAAERRR